MSLGFAPVDDDGALAPLNLPQTVLVEADVRRALWGFGREGGYRPGSFYEHIVRAFLVADADNRDRLAQGFPVLAFWMDLLGTRADGMTVATKVLLASKPWNLHQEACVLRHPAYWTRASRESLWQAPADLPCGCEL